MTTFKYSIMYLLNLIIHGVIFWCVPEDILSTSSGQTYAKISVDLAI
jgi:hypothetical protein